jgi:D-galactarolactone cycloisomerase
MDTAPARDLKILEVTAIPISYPLPERERIRVGVGQAVKKDTVVVRLMTAGGLVGYGEAHHARCPGAVAHLINTTLRQLVVGMDATDVVGIWSRVYKAQLASHGMGAGSAIALSGIDIALWDIRGKAVGWPLYRLLGGESRPLRAYAGGTSLGFQDPESLVDEVHGLVAAGYRAVKLRLGDSVPLDVSRVRAVRRAFDTLDILTDANTAYTLDDARQVMPPLAEMGVRWLEEPFPAQCYDSYREAKAFAPLALAAGENHYTRFEFHQLLRGGLISVIQPDLSKTGGITEGLRIAALASAYGLPIHPHTSMTGINMAATAHFLTAIDNPGYFESDVAPNNRFAKELIDPPVTTSDGYVSPPDAPGLGISVNEDFLRSHPAIEGPCYV